MSKNSEFGTLLQEGLREINARESLSLSSLKSGIAEELGVNLSDLSDWEDGELPRDPGYVEFIAKQAVRRGQRDIHWLRKFLHNGQHPEPDRIIDELFPMNPEFGNLLKTGLRETHARQDLSLKSFKIGIAEELGVNLSDLSDWEDGRLPRDPGCVAFIAEQAVRRGQCDIHWLRRFLHNGQHPEPNRIINKLFPDGEVTTLQMRHNMVRPQYSKFVGRKKELELLRKYLSSRYRHGVICISGQGGVGKTALATEIANHYISNHSTLTFDDRFDMIVYVSAKRFELNPSGKVPKYPSLTDLDSVLRALATFHGEDPAIFEGADIEGKIQVAYGFLQQKRTLLIIDNLEDVDDDYLRTFLQDLPSPSKALITTRHRIDVVVPIHLSRMTPEEAKQLAIEEAKELGLALTDEDCGRLAEETGGMPLAIKFILGSMFWRQSDNLDSELDKLKDPDGEFFDFVYEKSLEEIRGRGAYKLFLGLYFFPAGATRGAIGKVANLDHDHHYRDLQLEHLGVLSLVERLGDRFILNDLTRIFVARELQKNPDLERTAFDNLIEFYETWSLETELFDYQTQRPEIPNLISLMAELERRGEMIKLSRFFKRTHNVLNIYGYWDDRLVFVQTIVKWAVESKNWQLAVEFFPTYITSLHNWKRLVKEAPGWIDHGTVWANSMDDSANSQIMVAHKLYSKLRVIRAELLYDPTLENNQRRQQAVEDAVSFADLAYPIYAAENTLLDFAMSALFEVGSLLSDERRHEQALNHFDLAGQELDKLSDSHVDKKKWRAVIGFGKGLTMARQGKQKEGCKTIHRVIPDLVHMEDIVAAHVSLAYYEKQLGNLDAAKAHQAEARELRSRYNIHAPISLEEKWLMADM